MTAPVPVATFIRVDRPCISHSSSPPRYLSTHRKNHNESIMLRPFAV